MNDCCFVVCHLSKQWNLLFWARAWSRQSKHPSKLSSVLSTAVIFSFFKVSLRLSAYRKKKKIRNLTNNMAIMSHDKHHEQSALIVNELPHNIPKWQWTVLLHIFKINFTHLTQIWNIQSVYIKYRKYSTDCHRNLFQHSYILFSLFRKLARINWKKLKVNKKIRKLCK